MSTDVTTDVTIASTAFTRRGLAAGAGALLLLGGRPARAAGPGEAQAAFARIEAASGGRLGVSVLDTGTGARLAHRAGERFPLCSTFKLLAAAAVLARVDAGSESLERRVPYAAQDIVPYSPATEARIAEGGMPLADLCEAAITLSDNTAGNLLLTRIGGPAGLTAYLRGIGDAESRLDRNEPDLNEALPDDPRDTTTPDAMVANLQRLVLGEALSADSRRRLDGWLAANRTGGKRLRAGLPAAWRVGDKTGTGERGTANDVGVLAPPDGAPILAAVYLTAGTGKPAQRDSAIREVAEQVATVFADGARRRHG